MPNSTDNDAMPAWLKGDLPSQTQPEDAAGPETEAPAFPPAEEPAEEPAAAEDQPDMPPVAAAALAPEPELVLETTAVDDEAGEPLAESADSEERAAEMEPETDIPAAADFEPGEPEDAVEADAEAGGDAPATAAVEAGVPAAAEPAEEPLESDVVPDSQPVLADEPPRAAPEPALPLTLPEVEPLDLEALVEALLFVADGAVTVGQLAEALEVHAREIEAALAGLADSYARRGLSLQRFRDKVQLTTAPAAAAAVERFLGLAAAAPLSRAALEALAIIAYQQPVTRPQIEAVRGVNSDSVIKNLLSKGLIEETGRAEGPGRPVLYCTTPEFMQHFGLASLAELPPLALAEAGTPVPTQDEILKG